MNIQLTKANFLTGLQLVARTAGSAQQLPSLNCVLLEGKDGRLRLTTTDLDLGLVSDVNAKIESPGAVAVPIRLLQDIVSHTQAEKITLTKVDQKVQITAGASTVTLHTVPTQDFPTVPEIEKGEEVVIEASVLERALGAVISAAALDQSRPVLNAIAFLPGQQLRLVATDSFRLAEVTLSAPWKATSPLLLPLRTAQELHRLCRAGSECTIVVHDQQVEIRLGSNRLYSRTLTGSFPDYEKIIPADINMVVEVARQELIDAIKLADVFTKREQPSIRLTVSGETITISSESDLLGEEQTKLSATMTGKKIEQLTLTINGRYLLDGLIPQTGNRVQLGIVGEEHPVIFRSLLGEAEQFLYLVMPLHSVDRAPVAASTNAA